MSRDWLILLEKYLKEENVSRETLAKISVYLQLLDKWNKRINLISKCDVQLLIRRHVLDSLQLADLLKGQEDFVDMGSGGGFPGIIIAAATNIPGYLVESDKRKVIFLREVIRQTRLNLHVYHGRLEDCQLSPVSTITARALASLNKLIEWGKPLLKPDGFGLFLKGRKCDVEIHNAMEIWQCDIEKIPSHIDDDGVIVRVSHIEGKIGQRK